MSSLGFLVLLLWGSLALLATLVLAWCANQVELRTASPPAIPRAIASFHHGDRR